MLLLRAATQARAQTIRSERGGDEMKIIQISTTWDSDLGCPVLVALGDDGSLWAKPINGEWETVSLPKSGEGEKREGEGR